ncbi:MAG: DNA polymerase III subunit gamma/tau [Desulfobulbaceae bacterium]|nr:DNA polymerase III subunit gamma/tau [Desulfobulbaceae bacterium]
MSYLVLARKFRPQTFDEVVGQRPIVQTLQNALTRNRVAHALIFSGVRGVGKTTLARVMAKALNCETGPTPNPCNNCRSCKEIAAGSSMDLHEVDGASNRGIQEIRELKEKIQFMPSGSRYKIIIIDEVHMLTTEAFNALLKTLEEPPAHVYFMLATTELHKVPVTIMSRCQRYELKRVGHKELFTHFSRLAEQEKVTIEDGALNIIVREAGGSVRDGLSLLDQIFSYCGNDVSTDQVTEVLGLVSHNLIYDIGAALLNQDLATALSLLDSIYGLGMDLKRFVNDLLDWFRSMVLCKSAKNPALLLDLPEEEITSLSELAKNHNPSTIISAFNILIENLEKLSYSNRPRYILEMAFTKVIQAGEIIPVSGIIAQLDQLLQSIPPEQEHSQNKTPLPHNVNPTGHKPDSSPTEKKKSKIIEQPSNSVKAPPKSIPPQVSKTDHSLSIEKRPPNVDPKFSKNPIKTKHSTHHPPAKDNKDIRQLWPGFIEYVKDRKIWMGATLQRALGARIVKDSLVIIYNDAADCRLLKNNENISPLTEYALDYFQDNLAIRFELPDSQCCEVDGDSGKNAREERMSLSNEPLVRTALEVFNGQIGDIRIGPRFRESFPAESITDNDSINNQTPLEE